MATKVEISPQTSAQAEQSASNQDSDAGIPRMFVPTLKSIPPAMSALLSTYSSIPVEDQIPHIVSVRDKTYATHPYPCLGRFRFVDLDLSIHPLYQSDILPLMLRAPETFTPVHHPVLLDLGTCLGQDLRKLIYDGVDPDRLYGSDIAPGFIDAGYTLFRDEHKLPRDKHFLVPGDVFDDADGNVLSRLDGKVDVVNVTAVFHLFDLPQQVKVAHRVLRLLRRDPGQKVLIVGAQVGKVDAEASVRSNGRRLFRHNIKSWRDMWEGVFASQEWRDKVASYHVEGELQDSSKHNAPGRQLGDGGQRSDNMTSDGFKDFRWHLFWIWIEFK